MQSKLGALSNRVAKSIRFRSRRAFWTAKWPLGYPLNYRLYPKCVVVRTYWWNNSVNFGDILTPWILSHFGVACVHAEVALADLVGIGSTIQRLPDDWSGVVWGSGLIRDITRELPSARVIALRGTMTAARINRPDVQVLGDPGLLVSRCVERPAVVWDLGIVPHHTHAHDPLFVALDRDGAGVKIIDVQRGPETVAREIATCRTVLTSSLHGLVVADAFGIPAVWTLREPLVSGGSFKFHDYETVVSPQESRFMELNGELSVDDILRLAKAADPELIGQAQDDLLMSIGLLKEELGIRESVPFKAWSVVLREWVGLLTRGRN